MGGESTVTIRRCYYGVLLYGGRTVHDNVNGITNLPSNEPLTPNRNADAVTSPPPNNASPPNLKSESISLLLKKKITFQLLVIIHVTHMTFILGLVDNTGSKQSSTITGVENQAQFIEYVKGYGQQGC